MTIAEFFAMPVGTRVRWDRTGLHAPTVDGMVKSHDNGRIFIKWDDAPDEHGIHPDDTAVGEIVQSSTVV